MLILSRSGFVPDASLSMLEALYPLLNGRYRQCIIAIGFAQFPVDYSDRCFAEFTLNSITERCFNTRSGRAPRTTPSGRGGEYRPPIRSQLLLKLERRNVEGRWRPWGTLLFVNFMTLGQYLKGQMRSSVVKFAILTTILRLYADNTKSSRPIFTFLSLYDRAYILKWV